MTDDKLREDGDMQPPTAPTPEWARAVLRPAGPRPSVPEERLERVRRVVHEEWTRSVRPRRRRHWTFVAAGAAAVLVGVALFLGRPGGGAPPAPIVAHVERVTPLDAQGRAGDAIASGTTLVTGDRDRLAIRMTTGHSVRLDTASALRVESNRILVLDRGAIYVDSGPIGKPAKNAIEVATSLCRVRELGTQFEVRVEGAGARVRVRRGSVALSGASPELTLPAGREAELTRDGDPVVRDVATFGPEWEWVTAAAPTLTIGGRTLRESLEAIALERGERLEFEDDALADAASTVTLRGSVEAMSLDDALRAVASAGGVVVDAGGGLLTVRRQPPGDRIP